jgi:hypothetical protein
MSTVSQAPYMGIIRFSRHTTPKPVEIAGAQTPVSAINEITIYRAEYDRETQKATAKEALATWWMSDFQWGEAIARQNSGDGIPATLRHLKDHKVPSVQSENKAKRQKEMLDRLNEAVKPHSQILHFFDEAKSILENALSKGRLGKRDKEQVIHLLTTSQTNANSNMDYAIELLQELLTSSPT